MRGESETSGGEQAARRRTSGYGGASSTVHPRAQAIAETQQAMLGYTMFAFLFSWTDANWLHRRKTKMFRFTPTPVSSASIFWWCGKGGFADRKCTLDDSLERWFDARFPPLSIYYGGRDYLVLTEPLLERLERKEREVRVLKVTKLEESEVSSRLSQLPIVSA